MSWHCSGEKCKESDLYHWDDFEKKSKGRGDHVVIRKRTDVVNFDKHRIPLYCNVDKLTTC
jgi:hypothetical protein